MSHANIYNWIKWGFIPIVSQIKIEKLTKGKLKADMDAFLTED
jgi:hypothetical protein